MNETVELTTTETAQRLLPLLQEYATKMAAISERAVPLAERFVANQVMSLPSALELGRLICLHETLEKPATDMAREASGMIEHAALEELLRGELKLRLDEMEEHLRFSGMMIAELIKLLTSRKDRAMEVRKLIEKSGRYKAPF